MELEDQKLAMISRESNIPRSILANRYSISKLLLLNGKNKMMLMITIIFSHRLSITLSPTQKSVLILF